MWRFNDEQGIWQFDGYSEIYIYSKRIYEYPVCMHLEKLYLSITEAAIATKQRVDKDDFQQQRWQKE